MTDDERRQWLAGLRPGDRVAVKPYGNEDWRLGGTLKSRYVYDWQPDDPSWDIGPDSVEAWEACGEGWLTVSRRESELEPLPQPDMTGLLYVGPTGEELRRRSRRLARVARKLTQSGTASSARTPGGPAPRRTSGGRRSPGRP